MHWNWFLDMDFFKYSPLHDFNQYILLVPLFVYMVISHPSPQELQKHGSPDIVMALVGNKADLHERRDVPTQVRFLIHDIYNAFCNYNF